MHFDRDLDLYVSRFSKFQSLVSIKIIKVTLRFMSRAMLENRHESWFNPFNRSCNFTMLLLLIVAELLLAWSPLALCIISRYDALT